MSAARIEEAIAAGRNDACLIEWAAADLFSAEVTPIASIDASKDELAAAGWAWSEERRQMERDGWYAWYRSQGMLAPPIIQWGRVAA